MNKSLLLFAIIFLVLGFEFSFSQVAGREKEPEFNSDSSFIYESPRPLISKGNKSNLKPNSYGMDILISDSGFGFGFFWQRQVFGGDMLIFSNLVVSGARNTDEFEQFINGNWQVANKINRVFKFPLTIGVQKFIFKDGLSESLQPYITAGFGPTLILTTPYTYDRLPNAEIMGWFKSFNYAETYFRFGASVGIGAYFGNINNSILGVNIKYYYVPFGGGGIESIIGLPMTNFGGIFMSLSVGGVY